MSEPYDAAQRILETRDKDGKPVYDHVVQDASGQWHARRHDNHVVVETVDSTGRAGG
jgi:hypothetical protein